MKHKKPFTLDLTNRVLTVRAFGIWTYADAKEYVQKMRQLAQPLLSSDWALVLDVRSWQMSPEDVFALLRDNTMWCYQHNLKMAVVLLPNDKLLQWQFVKSTETTRPDDFISHIAADDTAAQSILRAAGYLA
ncbi:MAG TPA: hypothetical protein VLA40_03885 [Rheinheimera sp.]|nr:hypothetical protein [Rheinheimera sp.]